MGPFRPVYVRTRYNTANSDDGDYAKVDKVVTFEADELTKTVLVKTLSDTETESDEYFNINLYKSIMIRRYIIGQLIVVLGLKTKSLDMILMQQVRSILEARF